MLYIGEITKKAGDKEKYITLTISNSDIKKIKSSIEAYKGDADDSRYAIAMESLRDGIHQAWRQLNPS